MGRRRLRGYFLHNIDGRNCAVIVALNKKEVARAMRIAETEIQCIDDNDAQWAVDGKKLASVDPGRLIVRPITARAEKNWEIGRKVLP